MDVCVCMAVFIIILVVIIVMIRRQSSEDSKLDSVDLADRANSTQSLSGKEGIPDIKIPSDPQMALAQGRLLLVQDRRAEGVALLIHALREGPPDVSQEASHLLEELGEIETF
ncbi:MAG: hypothetical protein IMY76_09015 [Chloroflexi bacterium]|nr:hypothetical protein [Chloroflexota bacterium]